jgi:hypothetical protein
MSKKILVKESSFLDFLKSFFRAKSQGKEAKYIQTIRKYDPNLADKWSKFDSAANKHLELLRQYWLDKGDTKTAKEIEDLMTKY